MPCIITYVLIYHWLTWIDSHQSPGIFMVFTDVIINKIVTCSDVRENKLPATSDWFQIVQTNSVCCHHVHNSCVTLSKPWMLGKFWLMYTEWIMSGSLLPIACPWQIESIKEHPMDSGSYNSLLTIIAYTVGLTWSLLSQSRSHLS